MKKPVRIALTIFPILGAIGGVGGYMVYQMNKGNNDNVDNHNPQLTSPDSVGNINGNNDGDQNQSLLSRFKIFPEIHSQDFYKYLKIDSGKPFIDDNFISQVINKILKNIQISDGRIEWGYELNDDKDDLKITFNWISDGQGKVFTKTYRLNISKGV